MIDVAGAWYERAAFALFGIALAASAATLLHLQADLSFVLDEWDFLLARRDFDAAALLDPHNEHISVLPVLVYKALLSAFGMDSPLPFQVAQVFAALVAAALLFVYVRRRVGAWGALAAVIPILFLGASWANLLSAFQVAFFGAIACGLGAVLLFERADRRADPVVCMLLVLAVLWQSLGLAFVAGIGVAVILGRDRLGRAYVAVIPAAVFAAWWLGWGHQADSQFTLENLISSPLYVFDGFAASISSLLGFVGGGPEADLVTYGRPLLVIAIVVAALRVRRIGGIPRGLVIAVAIAVVFWFLAALNETYARPASNGRYQYPGAFFLVMIAAELVRGVRFQRRWLAVALAVALAAAVSGFANLRRNSDLLASVSERGRAGLAALEITRDTVDPAFLLTTENSDVVYFDLVAAGPYLSAVDEFGSPAFSERELVEAAEQARVAADKATAAALELRLRPLDPEQLRHCRRLAVGAPTTLPAAGLALAADRGDATIRLRRFATQSFAVDLGLLPAGAVAQLSIPSDRSARAWELEAAGTAGVLVCEHPPLVNPPPGSE